MMQLEFTVAQIASILSARVEGNEQAVIKGFGKIEEAKAGELTFLSNPKYEAHIYTTAATATLVTESFEPRQAVQTALIRVPDPYAALAQLMQMVAQQMNPAPTPSIASSAYIDPTATIAQACYIGHNVVVEAGAVIEEGCQIYPNTYIGRGVRIGQGTTIHANVSIYYGCQIGARCILHAGAVVGADGFGFAPQLDGYRKIPQLGNVVIEDDVELGANTCVDRAVMGSTVIRRGAKLDNLVQIAHNCEVGAHTVMAAQGGMAGSARIGSWCQTGGQVGIAGHLSIGDRVQLGGQTGVLGNIKSDRTILGSPAMDAPVAMRAYAVLPKLPELYRTVGRLEREVNEIKNQK